MDRRSELAALGAVGFRRSLLHRLIFHEHVLILALGLGVGVAAALIALLPTIVSPGEERPLSSILLSLMIVLGSGLFWTWAATTLSLKGRLISSLRNE